MNPTYISSISTTQAVNPIGMEGLSLPGIPQSLCRIGPAAFDQIIQEVIVPLLRQTELLAFSPIIAIGLGGVDFRAISRKEIPPVVHLAYDTVARITSLMMTARAENVVASLLISMKALAENEDGELINPASAIYLPGERVSLTICPLFSLQILMVGIDTGASLKKELRFHVAEAIIDAALELRGDEEKMFYLDEATAIEFPSIAQVRSSLVKTLTEHARDESVFPSKEAEAVLQGSLKMIGWLQTLNRLKDNIAEGQLEGSLNILRGLPGWDRTKKIRKWSCGGFSI